MRVVSVGGGPGGLFLAILLRERGLAASVTVYERNGRDDTFGFGVVFSDETLEHLAAADPPVFDAIAAEFRHWGEIDVFRHGRPSRSTGHGFAAIGRLRLLQLLTARAEQLGVEVRFDTEIADVERLRADHDLVVAADGANSGIRSAHPDAFGPSIEWGSSRYAWFGTSHLFDSFTFIFENTEHGLFQAHCYPYSSSESTLIVETTTDTWRRAGLDASADRYTRPGDTDLEALRFTEELFAKYLDGEVLIGNNSKWLQFPTVTNRSWHSGNVVLLGDAAHTAHFSVGSGTKLAMEDAIALTAALETTDTVAQALVEYEQSRRPPVESLQRAAATSRAWFEDVARYLDLDDEQFVFQLLTRSQRITHENLEKRDPDFVAGALAWFRDQAPIDLRPDDPTTPPMFYPLRLRELVLGNRVGVSPMAQYCAVDGVPTDWHLVHLGSRAVGGAGLVMTEMTCPTPDARITPGCTGLWNGEQQEAWRRVVEFVHDNSDAAIGIQLGHAGRKGSVKVPWEGGGDHTPLDDGNWPLLAPSALAWAPHNQVPQEMTRRDMERVTAEFVHSARLASDAGFDLLELHMAHGYLLSSFLSPLTNRRLDEYGGGIEGRARWPLEVFDAVRAAWPENRPMSVRISAVDWVEDGNTGDDAVALARLLAERGCDAIDVSTGQVHPDQTPKYGRLYQTPFSDRIRHEVGIATMTVGAVSSVDDVNTILLAGRADLALLARPHLVDPYWTLNAAIDQGYAGHHWPDQYLQGQTARRREQDPLARIVER
jgi:anthraniloyl-CoA monooxygenase